jgi:hypothetical protein
MAADEQRFLKWARSRGQRLPHRLRDQHRLGAHLRHHHRRHVVLGIEQLWPARGSEMPPTKVAPHRSQPSPAGTRPGPGCAQTCPTHVHRQPVVVDLRRARHPLPAYPGHGAPVPVGAPRLLRHVEPPVDQSVPSRNGVNPEHGDLAVPDPTDGYRCSAAEPRPTGRPGAAGRPGESGRGWTAESPYGRTSTTQGRSTSHDAKS